MSLNHVSIQGRICNDIELRRTNTGTAVATLTVAVDRDFSKEKESDFFDVVCWKNTAEFVSKYFAKGRMIVVAGRLQTRSWTDKDGHKRKTVEIVADNVYFGDSKKDAGEKHEAAMASTNELPDWVVNDGDADVLPF